MKHLKLFFALFAMLALGVGNAWGAEETATLSFADKAQRTSFSTTKQVWEQNGIVFTNNKAKSSTNIADYAKPVRLYKSSEIVVECTAGNITKIVFDCNTKDYATQLNNSFTGGSLSNDKVTVALDGTSKTFTIAALANQVRLDAIDVTYVVEEGATKYTVTIADDIQNGSVTADVTEAIEQGWVTLTPTPNQGYKFEKWAVKDANGTEITVTNNKFQMPASNVTVSASFVAKTLYSIKWNVAEGSVADTQVYEGDALGTLPTAENCAAGKVFIGWTEEASVNADGSGIAYVKETTIPNANKSYNAIYAVETKGEGEEGTSNVTLVNGTHSDASITWATADYATIKQEKNTSSSDVNSSYISAPRWYVGHKITFTPDANVNLTQIVLTLNTSYMNFGHANTVVTNANYEINNNVVTITPVDGTAPITIVPGAQIRPTAIQLSKGPVVEYSDYSLTCEANNDPYLNVAQTEVDFGTIVINSSVEKTLSITGGALSENVSLTISGTDATLFAVSPATINAAEEISETVELIYTPTTAGEHIATLTITSGTAKEQVTLKGKALAPTMWQLVTDVNNLNVGDEIVIVSAEKEFALSTTQNTNNRGQQAVTKIGNTVDFGTDVQVLKVESGTKNNTMAFSTGSGYLYAASTTSNYLRTQSTKDDNASWTIAIEANGVATVKAQGTNTRNWLRHNDANKLFSCYASGQGDICIYKNTDVVPAPSIGGKENFINSTIVDITSAAGLKIYYTTDGTDPVVGTNLYTSAWTITDNTTVKAISYDESKSKSSAIVTKVFTKKDFISCAESAELSNGEVAYMNAFDVVYVVKNAGYTYIKDESGVQLIYDNELDKQLKAGDKVTNFVGTASPYYGLPELKYNKDYSNIAISTGTITQPTEFTAAPAVADVNKFVVFKNVEFASAVSFTTDKATNATMTVNGEDVTVRNQFKFAIELDANKAYDVYGFVGVYNTTVQLYFLTASDAGSAMQTYNVTYSAGDGTGTAPQDAYPYVQGMTVSLPDQGNMTKAGFTFNGWKYEETVYDAGSDFVIPATNVTLTAQWKENKAPMTFNDGIWVLVTDVAELVNGDKVLIAAADYNVAMKAYEAGNNNCKQTNVSKYGINNCFVNWTSEVGVFNLGVSGSKYTFQDVNSEEYLYAAGATSSNHLKAGKFPTDETSAKYYWTISIAEGKATVKATVTEEGARNILRYNDGTQYGQLFSCYASGQKDIAIYKYVSDPAKYYTRDGINAGGAKYGTLCLPYASSKYAGAEFYKIAGKETGKVTLVAEEGNLEAGVPYIFFVKGSQLVVAYEGTAVGSAANENGLYGTFDDNTSVAEGNYIISQGKVLAKCGTGCYVNANRAYVVMDEVSSGVNKLPGRKYITMDVQEENEATGLDNNQLPITNIQKAIENGQLIIIRDGVKYNVQGQVIK